MATYRNIVGLLHLLCSPERYGIRIMKYVRMIRKKNSSFVFVAVVMIVVVGVTQVFTGLNLNETFIVERPQDEYIAFVDYSERVREISKLQNDTAHAPVNVSGIQHPVLPGLHTYLPHMAGRPDLVMPRFNLTGRRRRSDVKYVIGIPSIRRPNESYLMDTVDVLFKAMNEQEKEQILVIVCVTEPWDEAFELETLDSFSNRFPSELKSGHLEVITPMKEYYPNLNNIKATLGDKPERVTWRSKQNLDYAYLMLHAVNRGDYYIQLEDDVTAKYGFVTKMTEAITKQRNQDWVMLQLSTLGFIGRLFRSREATRLLTYIFMFFDKAPCDWLLGLYLRTIVCVHESEDKCRQKIRIIAPQIKPTLFQHRGLRSSYKGVKNKLKDIEFNRDQIITFHANPVTDTIKTNIRLYKPQHSVMEVYLGEGIFWGVDPRVHDTIEFKFKPAVKLKRLYFISGGFETATGDIFDNSTVVEVLPGARKNETDITDSGGFETATGDIFDNSTVAEVLPEARKNEFRLVGRFNTNGTCNAEIPPHVGAVTVVRIRLERAIPHWVILKLIDFVPA